ncbi:MAG: hypothetical protein LIP01_13465, partial [Tannerellaceae bacterium]|nr:hypothetical protein [Tannerellaceae bacterium]
AGTLPQIFKLQGLDSYTFLRPEPHEKNLPAELFWWESPDGSKVQAYRIPKGYNEEKTVHKRIGLIMDERETQPMKSYMSFYGVGDHGGGPTKETIKSIEALKKEKGAPTLFYSSADRYFDDIRADKSIQIPVVKDDLQYHAVGCYTAESSIKKNNRLAEAALIHTEKVTALGTLAWKVSYPAEDLTKAWHRVLFMQFHDSLAGSSLFQHSQTALEGYTYALDTANRLRYLALQKLEWQIPTEDSDSKYLVVFNPHAREVKEHLEYELGIFGKNPGTSHVEDENGNPLPHQWVSGASETSDRRMICIQASIPPMGYRQLRIRKGQPATIQHPVTIQNNSIENQYIKIRFSTEGCLSITDKANGKEVFKGGAKGCRAVVMDDPSDSWSHAVTHYSKEIEAFGNATFKIIESGPLKATLRVHSTYGKSTLTIDWTLYAGSRMPEAKVTLDWHERLKILKFSFPVNTETSEATYEIPYGYLVRKNNGNEVPGQRWIDVTGKKGNKTYGFALLNDAKYGYDVKGTDMHLSVVRSAVYAHHDPKKLEPEKEYIWMDQGIQTFRMKLVPHTGSWQDINLPALAEEFLTPSTIVYQGIHPGKLPRSASFMNVQEPNILLSSIKISEKGADLIMRCIETQGKASAATIDLPVVNTTWEGDFRPCEIKTLRVNRHTGEVKEVNLLEE